MKTLVLLIAIVSLAACSSDSGGNGNSIPGSDYPALTETQKDRMSKVNSEAQGVSNVAEGFNPDQKRIFNPKFHASEDKISPNFPTVKEKASQMENEMDQAFNHGYCKLTMTPDPSQKSGLKSPENMEIGFSIESSKSGFDPCPISYTNTNVISTSGSATEPTVKTTSMIEYRVTEGTDIYEIMDVVSYRLDVDSTVQTTKTSESSAIMTMGMSGNGLLVSKSEGEVNVDIEFSGRGNFASNPNTGQVEGTMNMDFTLSVTFGDFTAVGYSTVNMNISGQNSTTNAKFYINGDEVSEEEFGEIFQQEATTSFSSMGSFTNNQ